MLLTISRPWSHGLLALSLLACGARSALEEDGGGSGAGGSGATGAGAAGGVGGVGGTSPTVGGFGGEGGEGGIIDPECPTPDATFCTEPEPCYIGPAEVAGKGMCTLGERGCEAGGAGRSECAGYVLPIPNDCASPTSWTCSDAPHPCHPFVAATLTAEAVKHLAAVDHDTFYTTDGFELQKLEGGVHSWSYMVGANDVGSRPPLAHDATGVVVAGMLGASGFVAKVNPSGQELWRREFDTAAGDTEKISALGSAPDGGYFMGGRALGDEVLDGFTLPQGAYVAKLSSAGVVEWTTSLQDVFNGVNVVQARLDGSVVIGGTGHTVCGGDGIRPAVAAVDAGGKTLWAWSARDAGTAVSSAFNDYGSAGEVASLAVDPEGRVYASGRLHAFMESTLDFGDGIPKAGRVYVMSLDENGVHRWNHNFLLGDIQWASGGALAFTTTGHLTWATITPNLAVLRTFDTAGALLWERPIHANPTQPSMKLWALEPLADGGVLVGGEVEGPIELPTGTIPGSSVVLQFGP